MKKNWKQYVIIICSLFVIYDDLYAKISLGPYLQSPTASSINILFWTDTISKPIIKIGRQPQKWEKQYVTITNSFVFNIKINNLLENTTYYYGIYINNQLVAGGDSLHYFNTFVKTGQLTNFSVWALGDFGKGTEEQRRAKIAFEQYNSTHPTAFWLWLGDNAYHSGTVEEFRNKVFDRYYGYDSVMRFLPFLPTPGNHDYLSLLHYGGNKESLGAYYSLVNVYQQGEAGGVASKTEKYYSYNYGQVHFISLNSECWSYSVWGNMRMKNWLIKDLAANQQLFTVVYFHQPPYSKGSHDSDTFWELFMKAMRKRIAPVLEEYGVDLVVCGHSHVYERSFLIKGHYGKSTSFNPKKMLVSKSFGDVSKGDMPYVKFTNGKNANLGTIYATCGVGGRPEPLPDFGHPVMAVQAAGEGTEGSLILSFEQNKLTGKYLKGDGTFGDQFTLIKYTKAGKQKKKKVAEK